MYKDRHYLQVIGHSLQDELRVRLMLKLVHITSTSFSLQSARFVSFWIRKNQLKTGKMGAFAFS